jgi:hypothetical protein
MKIRLLIPAMLFLTSLLFAQTSLIWYPGGNAAASAGAIETALGGHVSSVAKTTSLSGITLTPANYDYVFVSLGVNPNNYVLDSTNDSDAIQKLIDFLNLGGKLYMEGGDTWAWDAQTSLQPYFNQYGEADGEGDLQTLFGASCLNSYSFSYGGSQNYMDRIAPLAGSVVLITNNNPAFACAIGYENTTDNYQTIAASFEFGGLTDGSDTKADLMGEMINFLDGGCSAVKPAPLNVQATIGYDSAVTIMWDAPPGQSSLSSTPSDAPSLTRSSGGAIDANVKPKAGRQRPQSKSQDLAIYGKSTTAFGYQVDSYNIYRSTTSGSSYTQIASGVNRQFYRDATASNEQTYYYIVKGNYSGAEGDASNENSGQATSGGNTHASPWKFVVPSIDGDIVTDEWSNATSRLITAPGQSSPVTLYTFHNDNFLYFAVDESGNTALATDDQIGISFDENLNYNWPASSTSEEGTIWLSYASGSLSQLFRGLKGWWPLDVQWATPTSAAGITTAASTNSGHVQYEARLDLSSGVLDVNAGDSFGMYIYTLDFPDSNFSGAWPAEIKNAIWQDAWLLPSLYGVIDLAAKGSCPFIEDMEAVTAMATNYSFNEFGDGRKLELNFGSLTGQGNVTVVQTNECIINPATAKYINCAWTVAKEAAITDFVTTMTVYYNDTDVSSLDESKLQVHRWIESTSSWQYEGGTVNTTENTVTLSTNQPGKFALFERSFVQISAKVLLQGSYDASGLMTTELNSNNAIPLTSTLADSRVIAAVPAGVTDWMMLELRTAPDGSAVSQRSFFLKNSGDIVDWDGATATLNLPDAVDGTYYIVVKHRNHLAAMSASAVALNSTIAAAYDFSTDINKYYGSDASLLDTSPVNIYGLYAGDATSNGQVQNDDKNEDWKAQTGTSGYKSADFNLNAQVQNNDKNDFWKVNVGRGTQVP